MSLGWCRKGHGLRTAWSDQHPTYVWEESDFCRILHISYCNNSYFISRRYAKLFCIYKSMSSKTPLKKYSVTIFCWFTPLQFHVHCSAVNLIYCIRVFFFFLPWHFPNTPKWPRRWSELAASSIWLSSCSSTLTVHVTRSRWKNISFQRYLIAAMEKSQLDTLVFPASTRK